MKNYYKILNIPFNATPLQIKSAYKKMALKFHPDKNPSLQNGKEKFQEVNIAYKVLSDPIKKKKYDDEYKLRQLKSEGVRVSKNETTKAKSAKCTTGVDTPVWLNLIIAGGIGLIAGLCIVDTIEALEKKA